ncbi:MAG: YceI family protein, partial [Jeotgalicoccus sp.]|nr:YceI family protein [Jeotgalicoccus sp.]
MAKFVADTAHSELEFQVKHMMVTKVKGTFGEWSIDIEADDIEDFTTAKITGRANTATIDTNVADRDAHLTSADFFDVENNPEITFESTKVEGSGKKFEVTGNLTIKDVTNEVTIPVEYNGSGVS